MKDWNLVVSVYQDGFRRAIHALKAHGDVDRCAYHNVLVMAASDPVAVLSAIERETADTPALYDAISRIAPAAATFDFHSAEEFVEQAKMLLVQWLPRLAGHSFHVRLHRRGFKHDMRSPDAELLLDEALLAALEAAGTPGSISFESPDAVIAIDTVDDRAGMALWSREDLARHRLLRPD